MTNTATSITTATIDYLDALKARSWDSPNYSESYKAQQRAAVLAPLRERVATLTAQARAARDKTTRLADLSGIIDDQSDPQRVIARELAWQRLAPVVQSGDLDAVENLARVESAVGCEALHMGLAALAATDAPNSQAAVDHQRMIEAVHTAYPHAAGAPDPVREAAELAEQLEADIPVAEVADAVIAGKGYMQIGGEKLSALLGTDTDEGRVLYDTVADDGHDALMAQAKADDAVHYDGKPESN
ncbi:MAG: hypothetical protein SOH99_12025 [Acidipropionibacterium acidipropionici]|jgi:hypothetical protein|uniref:hypothetical protein n=1 Tax=Acidipropionibacterium acidipropionici TaxID=1748 RepID=UPI002F3573C2